MCFVNQLLPLKTIDIENQLKKYAKFISKESDVDLPILDFDSIDPELLWKLEPQEKKKVGYQKSSLKGFRCYTVWEERSNRKKMRLNPGDELA